MNWKLLAAAIFALPANSLAQKTRGSSCRQADLSSQFFQDAAPLSQGRIGSCHSFASIGLLEAALFRQGQSVRLSQADLFVRRIAADEQYFDRFWRLWESQQTAFREGSLLPETDDDGQLPEGEYPSEDLKFAITNGIATAASVPYAEMAKKYIRHADELRSSMRGENLRAALNPGLARLNKKIMSAKHFTDPFGRDNGTVFYGHWSSDVEEKLLGGPAKMEQLRQERFRVLRMIADFKLGRERFYASDPDEPEEENKNDKKARLSRMREQRKNFFIEHFCRSKVPLAVNMELAGAHGWDVPAKSTGSYHAFIITGFVTDSVGKIVLKTRNSYADNPRPPVLERDFDKIREAYIVYAPADGAVTPP